MLFSRSSTFSRYFFGDTVIKMCRAIRRRAQSTNPGLCAPQMVLRAGMASQITLSSIWRDEQPRRFENLKMMEQRHRSCRAILTKTIFSVNFISTFTPSVKVTRTLEPQFSGEQLVVKIPFKPREEVFKIDSILLDFPEICLQAVQADTRGSENGSGPPPPTEMSECL